MRNLDRSRRHRTSGFALLVVGVCSLASCGDQRGAEQVVPGDAGSTAAVPQAARVAPSTPEDLFPETGSRGLVVNNCATCHALACAAMGQRDESEWRAVEARHEYAIPGLSIEDRGKIFDYLKRNFNEAQPEPVIPPEFLERGCGESSSIP